MKGSPKSSELNHSKPSSPCLDEFPRLKQSLSKPKTNISKPSTDSRQFDDEDDDCGLSPFSQVKV